MYHTTLIISYSTYVRTYVCEGHKKQLDSQGIEDTFHPRLSTQPKESNSMTCVSDRVSLLLLKGRISITTVGAMLVVVRTHG